jgi:hypothetical protein
MWTANVNDAGYALLHLLVQYLASLRQLTRYHGSGEQRLKARRIAAKLQKGIDQPRGCEG